MEPLRPSRGWACPCKLLHDVSGAHRIHTSLALSLSRYLAEQRGELGAVRSTLMAAHQSAVLRRDAAGQETLLNLLLRSYLADSLYDQVGRPRGVQASCAAS